MKGDFRHIIATHKRGVKELYTVSHRLFPVIALGAVVSALFLYVSVFFFSENSLRARRRPPGGCSLAMGD